MTQEQKELLIKDLSARLPYGVYVEHTSGFMGTLHDITVYFTYDDDDTIKDYVCYTDFFGDESCKIEFFKPYLFPLSSMTEEDYATYFKIWEDAGKKAYLDGCPHPIINIKAHKATNDYLLSKHYDINDLIPKGLANDATGKNIY